MTPRALRALKTAAQHPLEFLAFHVSGYWGQQRVLGRYWNQRARHVGDGRMISTYATTRGEVLRVIIEVAGEVTIFWHEEDS